MSTGHGRYDAILGSIYAAAGDPARWPHPPYEGVLEGGRIWGRGAVDIKGPLAAQVIAGARLLRDERPPGDVWVTCTVQEEIGGAGARFLTREPPARLVVVGEPSRGQVRRGHRGRYELLVHVRGASVHGQEAKFSVTAEQLAELVKLIESGEISGKQGKEVFAAIENTDKSPRAVVDERGMRVVSDTSALTAICEKIVAENPGPAADVRAGKKGVLGFFVGKVMKETKGSANPKLVSELFAGAPRYGSTEELVS